MDIGSGEAAPMFLRSISDWETVGVRVWGKTGALLITYTILVVPYSNYGIMAQNPILIIKAPISGAKWRRPCVFLERPAKTLLDNRGAYGLILLGAGPDSSQRQRKMCKNIDEDGEVQMKLAVVARIAADS